jgi:uncharacterized protein DUF222
MHTTAPLRSNASLESELLAVPCQVAATKSRGLHILAELDARDAWEELGYNSGVHWLRARLGLSRRTATDQLRVARALVGLPCIASAFETGQISYSKVRAITRTATPETERALLELAATHNSATLERLSRPEGSRGRSSSPSSSGELHWRWDEAGNLRVRLRLPTAQGTQFIEELEALIRRAEQDTRSTERASSFSPAESRRAEALLAAMATNQMARPGRHRVPIRRPRNRRHDSYPPAWSAALERRKSRSRPYQSGKPSRSTTREPGIPVPRQASSARDVNQPRRFRK